jgi:putative transposase
MDIFSREVVGWTVAERESEIIARELIARTCQREGIDSLQLTLHADRGSPMIAGSMAELLDDLGVHQSHSKAFSLRSDPGRGSQTTILTVRPNYSGEALFKTLKY